MNLLAEFAFISVGEPISQQVTVEVFPLSELQSFNRRARVSHTITGSLQEEIYYFANILLVFNPEDMLIGDGHCDSIIHISNGSILSAKCFHAISCHLATTFDTIEDHVKLAFTN